MIYEIEDQEELRLNNELLDLSSEELGTMSEALGKLIFRGVFDRQ